MSEMLGMSEQQAVPFAPTVDWWSISPAERLRILEDLRVFVARVIVTYGHRGLGSIPRCWEQHEGAVRLLDALHRSYLIATHPNQVGEALIGWHHNLTYVRDELKSMFSLAACTDSHHQAFSVPQWAAEMNEQGKDAQAWKQDQEAALSAYRQQAVAAGT